MIFSQRQLQEYKRRIVESINDMENEIDRHSKKLDEIIKVIDMFELEEGSPEHDRADVILDEMERLLERIREFENIIKTDESMNEWLSNLFSNKSAL